MITSIRAFEELTKLKNNERGGAFYGGTLSLDIDDHATGFNVSGKHFCVKDGAEDTITDTPEIRKLVCEIYVENKSEHHAHYQTAKDYLAGVIQ